MKKHANSIDQVLGYNCLQISDYFGDIAFSFSPDLPKVKDRVTFACKSMIRMRICCEKTVSSNGIG